MTRPGDRLRLLAAHMFDAETMEHLIDPVVADLQQEYAEASRAGRIWRRRRVRLAGYIALAKVTTRSMRVFLVLTCAMTLLLEWPALARYETRHVFSLMYLTPQALVVAVPVALTFAIAWNSELRRSRQFLTATVAAGAVCSALSFLTLAWWIPSWNQAFRVSMAHETGLASPSPPGHPEMTIGELRREIKRWTRVQSQWPGLEFSYYWRWAFPCASLSLALLMMALHQRGARRRFMLLAGAPILFGYYVLMFLGREYGIPGGGLHAAVGAWMPNAIAVLTAAAIATLGTRRPVTE